MEALSSRHFDETIALLLAGAHGSKKKSKSGNKSGDGGDSSPPSAAAWHASMLTALDPKATKYAKAVGRILGKPANRYHAIEYRDFDALGDCDLINALGLTRASMASMDADVRAETWAILQKSSAHARSACGYELQTPGIEEIQRNIAASRAQRRATKQGGPSASMTQAFQTALEKLAAALDSSTLRERVRAWSSSETQDACSAWAAFVTPDTERAVQGRTLDVEATKWPILTEAEAGALRASLRAGSEAAWGALESLNSFSKVNQHIPANMMSKIEATAQQLASAISSGEQSLETLDLASIGEQVLGQCSEEDMSQVANNLQSLLPTLGSLQKAVAAPKQHSPPRTELK